MFDKTFFVLSPSYHGATLLAKLLNAHPEVTALGDTYPSNRFDQLCGCGERVSRCHFWQSVKNDVASCRVPGTRGLLPHYPNDRGGRLGRLLYSDFTSFWATPGNLRRLHRDAALKDFRLGYEAFLASIYAKIPQPGQVFADGVKFVSRVSALQAAGFHIDGIIHLYRHPVDFAASSMRTTGRNRVRGLVEHSLRYRFYHRRARQIEKTVPHIEVSYEAMSEEINEQLARIFRFLDVEALPLETLRTCFDQEWHFMGNASLFDFDGVISRRQHSLAGWQVAAVKRIAGPGLS
jgi:hypothetical protein